MKVFPGRLNWRSATIRTSRGGTRSTAVPPESLVGSPGLRRAKPSADTLSIVLNFSCCIGVGGPRGSRPSAGRISRGSAVPLAGYRPAPGSANTPLRRNKPPGTNVGQAECPNGGHKSSKLMGGAPAQGRAIQPGASEPPIPWLCRMGRRPNRFRPSPAMKPGSKLNRTAPSGKVSLLASTDTYIRLANLSFGRSGRAH